MTAPGVINGNGGADTISMSAPVTLNSGDFANVSGVQSLQLTGASRSLGADAATAGIVNVVTGNGATSITDSNGVPLNVDATALADNTALKLVGDGRLHGDGAAGRSHGHRCQRCFECDDGRGCFGAVDCNRQWLEHDHGERTDDGADVDPDRQQRGDSDAQCRGIDRATWRPALTRAI